VKKLPNIKPFVPIAMDFMIGIVVIIFGIKLILNIPYTIPLYSKIIRFVAELGMIAITTFCCMLVMLDKYKFETVLKKLNQQKKEKKY
jgi:hypothetical protein